MNKSDVSAYLGALWVFFLVAFLFARFIHPWENTSHLSDEAMAIYNAPYSLALRNGVLNIAVIVSLLGLVFTVANTSKLALTGVAALLVVALANLVYVRDNATAYEAKHPFDYNKYAMQQGSQGLPLIWWGQTSREDLDMVFRETLEFMATIPYRLLDQHTKKYNQAIERAHKQAGKVN